MAAVLITVNWGVYIYGVVNEHVVETSLGYFIGPLVTVALGVLVLHETLRPVQKVALGMTTAAVLGLTLDYGRPPWIALTLAVSFAVYGLLKKQVGAGAVEGLTIESAVMAPVALVYLVWLQSTGGGHAFSEGPGHLVLLASSGLVTALPLLCFGGAASRISLTTIGMVQYVGPDPAVPHRGVPPRRADAGRPLDRVRRHLAGPRPVHRSTQSGAVGVRPSPSRPPSDAAASRRTSYRTVVRAAAEYDVSRGQAERGRSGLQPRSRKPCSIWPKNVSGSRRSPSTGTRSTRSRLRAMSLCRTASPTMFLNHEW